MNKNSNIITVEGYTDDLLSVSANGEMKMTRLFYLMPERLEENSETIDLSITSTNPFKSFKVFDQLEGKKIRISVDVLGE